METKHKILRWILFLLLLFILTGMLFPMYWMVKTSLTKETGYVLNFRDLLPEKLTLRNYQDVWSSAPFLRFFFNSLIVAILVTLGNLIFCLMVGYAFARRKFVLKNVLFLYVNLVLMFPAHIIIVPLFILIKKLGWYDTYFALIIPWLVNPLGIFLMRQYIQNLPKELEDAARIDGAGDFKILFKIVLPLCKPALAVLAIQVFLVNWNSFLFPFILTSSEKMRTLPVALALYQGYQTIDWPHLMAASTICALPVIILFLFFQRQIISGLTAGALKQ
ncbi:MAG: carbohydrate ABC transporter permease [candidate division Zixibacteria bacterium]|nr:carbohydrate ABC transporter permease [candidate division Zixibacteria bacterium]